MNKEQTAIHESGHAVANARFEISQTKAVIFRDEKGNYAGRSEISEGCTGPDDAYAHIMSSLAGYAALVTRGHSEFAASKGCESDFEEAERLIQTYNLGHLDEWKVKAVEVMSRDENKAAVTRVADEILKREEINNDEIEICIDIADGVSSEEDYQQYRLHQSE